MQMAWPLAAGNEWGVVVDRSVWMCGCAAAAAANEGFKSELASVAGSLRKVLTSRGTESTEASSWSVLEASSSALGSPVPTPMSHSSEEIHPDFHLIDDLNCPLKKVRVHNLPPHGVYSFVITVVVIPAMP